MPSIQDMVGLDPRIKRTRQLLQDALQKLLSEKDFDRISVQDIAETATLNRATFYDHYSDKFALLECLVAARFRDLLQRRHIQFDGCKGAVKAMAIGVCSYLSEMPFASQRHSGQPLETAIVAVVRGMILEGLKSHHRRTKVSLGPGGFDRCVGNLRSGKGMGAHVKSSRRRSNCKHHSGDGRSYFQYAGTHRRLTTMDQTAAVRIPEQRPVDEFALPTIV